MRPAPLYTTIAAITWPVLRGLYRLSDRGVENVPADGGFVLASNHLSSFDPWPLGMPLWPRYFLRFMAKSELYWWPLTYRAERGRRLPRAPRAGRHAGDRDRRRARAGGPRRHDVPGGDAPEEGPREALRGAPALRCGADRPRGRSPARAGSREGNRQAARLGKLSVAYGAPVDIDDLRGGDLAEAAHEATERLMAQDRRARGVAVTGALLAVDGDSFAHRAYHSMPKSVRLNAIVGFTNMMLRLWQAERPDVVLVGWDTLEVPTYRHTAFEAYQSGRVFEDSILEQLAAAAEGDRRARLPHREGSGLRSRRLPRGGRARMARAGARRDVGSRRVSTRKRPGHDPRADAWRLRAPRGSGRTRSARSTASSPSRCPT